MLATLSPGDVVDGYAVQEKLGSGGFGTVYRVTREGHAPRALKVLNSDLMSTPVMVRRFEREVATVRALAHEGCVSMYESGRLADESPYFIMELLDGEDLGQRLERRGRMSYTEVLETLRPVCAVLQAAHAQGVVHRDIKASNVFLTTDGRTVVLDFGIAKVLETPGMTLTLTRQIIGTPCAMSPEQLMGRAVDARTDVYGLGALAFHMLTGVLPFASDSATVMQELHGYARRVLPSTQAPVSDAIDRVIVEAMAIDPTDRHVSCEEFFRALEFAICGGSRTVLRSAQAFVVHLQLGAAGDDVARAEARAQTCDQLLRVFREGGFQVLARSSRGAACALLLSEDAVAARVECARAEEVAVRAREVSGLAFELVCSRGPVQVQGRAVLSGAALVPPRIEMA